MLKFKSFFSESHLHEAAMVSSGTTGERHVSQYLQPSQLKSLSYTMAKDSGGAKKGETVKVVKVVTSSNDSGENTYHARIQHPGGTSTVPINHLMKPEGVGRAGKGAEEKEDTAVSSLHSSIQNAMKENNSNHIKITHMGKTFKIAGARKVVSGDFKGRKPKADIILHDENGTPQIFLSHKAGARPTQAQNYEGLSGHTEYSQVSKFLSDIKSKTKNSFKSGQSFVRRFVPKTNAEKKLHKDVMFGSEQSSGVHGVHNVHSIAHGNVGIMKKGSKYHLTSDYLIDNDDAFKHNEHPLEFTARYMTDRKDHGIGNARIGIAKAGSRPSSEVI